MSIFEEASRKKLRFTSPKGTLCAEDLWDLGPVREKGPLDLMAQAVYQKLGADDTVSFVTARANINPDDELRLDIILHVIATLLAEQKIAAKEAEYRAEDQEIMAAIKDKKSDELKELSIKELRKKLKRRA